MQNSKYFLIFILMLFLTAPLTAQNGKISGKAYFDYTYDLNKNANSANLFEFHRVYFGYEKQLTEKVKFKLTTDVGRMKADDRLSVYLKYTYVDWKTTYGHLIFGLQSMNIFSIQEHNWGYRFLEKSPMDYYKWSSSADLGFGYKNTFKNKFHLWALVTNGPGYKHKEKDKYKKVSVALSYGEQKLTKKDGFNAGLIFALEPYDVGVDTTKNKTLVGVFGAFARSGIRAGAEFDLFRDAGNDQTKQIIGVFATYKLKKNLEIVTRIDLYDPNINSENDGQTYLIAGINWTPQKNLNIVPNLRYTTYQNSNFDAMVLGKINFQFKF